MEDKFAEVRSSVIDLLSRMPEPPRMLRVTVGDVSVEMEWPEEAEAAGQVPQPARPDGQAAAPRAVSADGGSLAASNGEAHDHFIGAPIVGTFYEAAEPGAKPFVSPGDPVSPGQQVAIVEAMKMMIPVEAEHSGKISEVMKTNGESVEFGEPLFAFVKTS